jgi:MFS family permease
MKQHIAADFSLDDAQMGWVFTSFILAYAIFEIPTARWADRHGAGAVLTRIVSWWSVFTLMTAGAFNYASLLVTRFLFGAGEAGAFPCVARVLSRWVPLRERGTAKGFSSRAYASAALTTCRETRCCHSRAGELILLVFGCVGFIWVIAWKRWFPRRAHRPPAANEAERALILADRTPVVAHPPGFAFWGGLLKQRNVLLLCLSYMPNCATFYFCITWLPSYLREHRGFESTQLGMLAALPLALAIGTQFLGGFWSDKIVVRFGLRAGRRTPGIVGYGVAALFSWPPRP